MWQSVLQDRNVAFTCRWTSKMEGDERTLPAASQTITGRERGEKQFWRAHLYPASLCLTIRRRILNQLL